MSNGIEYGVGALLGASSVVLAGMSPRAFRRARSLTGRDVDPLTRLANREGFERRLDAEIRRSRREGSQLVVALMDIDLFAAINQQQGFSQGDRMLVECGRMWTAGIPAGGMVARYGSDEFAILLPRAALGRATDLVELLRELTPSPLTVSAGVAAYWPGDTTASLIKRVYDALHDAKATGRNRTVVHGDPDRTASEIEDAVEREEMRVLFQPITDLKSRTPVAFEALVRWQHPTRGLLGPQDFVPQAERTGAIHSLGAWVLKQAMALAEAGGTSSTVVTVNASMMQLRSNRFLQLVKRCLAEWDLPAANLVIEITESVFDDDDPQILRSIMALRDLGARIAIDDFGAGYSTLRRLDTLPIDILKLDGALVKGIKEDSFDAPILEAIATMCHSLGVTSLVEFIETEHQAEVVGRLGFDWAQGYLFGRPQKAEVVLKAAKRKVRSDVDAYGDSDDDTAPENEPAFDVDTDAHPEAEVIAGASSQA